MLACNFCGRTHVTLKAVREVTIVNPKSGKVSKGKVLGYTCENCSRIYGGK